MLLVHGLTEYIDAVTHAAAHAPAQPGITEALGTTDNHTFEWAGKDVRRRAEWVKSGVTTWGSILRLNFDMDTFLTCCILPYSLVFGLCIRIMSWRSSESVEVPCGGSFVNRHPGLWR